MATWIEYRCENRFNKSSGDSLPENERCYSHDNRGPMEMAEDTRASVIETLQQLDDEARSGGWKKTREGWLCPFCVEAIKTTSRTEHGEES
ncbi:hypothetical protein [Pseudomonas sp. NPDC096950]|uniref:hypothetical protein n=1 Tax=Pseudomonas sp. NPDC096950 TaxID=3364485 RepID=UPI00383A7BBB